MDNIEVYQSGNDKIAKILSNNADMIKDEVLAVNFYTDTETETSKEWNINGEKVLIGLKKM